MSDVVALNLPECLPRLWRLALRLTRDPHDAEDLVQRTCLRALEKKHLYRDQNRLLSWLFAIEHRLWLSDFSDRYRHSTDAIDDNGLMQSFPDKSAGPEDIFFYQQVRSAVNQLREPYRSVIQLVAVEECSYEECAQILEIPIGTVMSRLSRARQMIGTQFAPPTSAENLAGDSTVLPFNPFLKRQVKR